MHTAAKEFVKQYATLESPTVIEIGSRYINGTIRLFFPNAKWTGIDLRAGRLVDWVGNAMDFTPPDPVDMVICCEVLEHTPQWREIIVRAGTWLKNDGVFIMTCAGPGRKPHSAIDGGRVRPKEHYANITAAEVQEVLNSTDMRAVICREFEDDTQLFAVKRKG